MIILWMNYYLKKRVTRKLKFNELQLWLYPLPIFSIIFPLFPGKATIIFFILFDVESCEGIFDFRSIPKLAYFKYLYPSLFYDLIIFSNCFNCQYHPIFISFYSFFIHSFKNSSKRMNVIEYFIWDLFHNKSL